MESYSLSRAPIAGGQYYWVWMLGPVSCQKMLSYVIGWLTLGAWVLKYIANSYNLGFLILVLRQHTYSSYTPKNWQLMLVMWASGGWALAFNTIPRKFQGRIQGLMFLFHLLPFFAFMIALRVSADFQDAQVALNTWMNSSFPTQSLTCLTTLEDIGTLMMGADLAMHVGSGCGCCNCTMLTMCRWLK